MKEELKILEDKATEIFCQKPHWKKIYDGAPEKAKDYYRLMFANSVGVMAKGFEGLGDFDMDAERDRVYQGLGDEDWKYLMENAGHAEAQGLYIVRQKLRRGEQL